MNYDFDYYSGADLKYPTKPVKPTLGRNPSSTEARAFAEALEDYEREFEGFKENLNYYNDSKSIRMKEFEDTLRIDFSITQAQFDIIWRFAYEAGHSYGLSEVYTHFDNFYSMASEFAALEK